MALRSSSALSAGLAPLKQSTRSNVRLQLGKQRQQVALRASVAQQQQQQQPEPGKVQDRGTSAAVNGDGK